MLYTKVFKSGNSQAVRIPKEFNLKEKEMRMQKVGSSIILSPKENPWEAFEKSLGEFTKDFMSEGRSQPPMQMRKGL